MSTETRCAHGLWDNTLCEVCSPHLVLKAAPTEGATMKDSHGQTVQEAVICEKCGMRYLVAHRCSVPVQDYREYTAEEILHGIVESTEQAGWGDPANLGHWLGAAQRWALNRNV